LTPEGIIKDRVKKVLRAAGAYYHMPVSNGMGAPSLDFIACYRGHFIAIETKAPGKKPTPRQLITMRDMAAAGGFVFIVSCQHELDVLQEYLNLLGD
jgi:hypothetical protein